MEFLLEALFQIVGEFLLQILFEAVAELGFHRLKETFKKPRNPIFAGIGFFLWGLLAGGISLLVFPRSFISSRELRILNLIVTPLVAGETMRQIGKLRERRGQNSREAGPIFLCLRLRTRHGVGPLFSDKGARVKPSRVRGHPTAYICQTGRARSHHNAADLAATLTLPPQLRQQQQQVRATA